MSFLLKIKKNLIDLYFNLIATIKTVKLRNIWNYTVNQTVKYNNNMTTYYNRSTYFRNLTVNFNSHVGIKQLEMTSKDRFYKVYSPLKFKLRPRDDIYLDLIFDIQTPEILEPWLNLLPSLKGIGLHIENDDWINNKTKGSTIQMHLQNKNFTRTIYIKKDKCIGFIFFIRQKSYRFNNNEI